MKIRVNGLRCFCTRIFFQLNFFWFASPLTRAACLEGFRGETRSFIECVRLQILEIVFFFLHHVFRLLLLCFLTDF